MTDIIYNHRYLLALVQLPFLATYCRGPGLAPASLAFQRERLYYPSNNHIQQLSHQTSSSSMMGSAQKQQQQQQHRASCSPLSSTSSSFVRYNDKYTPITSRQPGRRSQHQVTPTPSPSSRKQQAEQQQQQAEQQLSAAQATCSVLKARVAALKQQLTVKSSEAAALAEQVSTLSRDLERANKSEAARVSASAVFQKAKTEAAAAAKHLPVLESCLQEVEQRLQSERSAHELTAQREEQAAAALAAEHQRLGSSCSALMAAHQQLQARHAEIDLLRAQLADADAAVAQLQEGEAGLWQQLQQVRQATAHALAVAAAERVISSQLAAHNRDLQQQLSADASQQQEPAASSISISGQAAAHQQELSSLEAKLKAAHDTSSTASALPTAQQEQPVSHAAAEEAPVADCMQQESMHSSKAQHSKHAQHHHAMQALQQQLLSCQALLQKQSDAAAAATAKASAAEWRAAKLSAECSHLQQQHSADVAAMGGLRQHVQELQGQLLLLQESAASAEQQQVQVQEEQLQALLLPHQGSACDSITHSLDTVQHSKGVSAVRQQHSRPQYVPPTRDTSACLDCTSAAAAVQAADRAAASALSHCSSSKSLTPSFEAKAAAELMASVQLSRQWGSGMCDPRCSESGDTQLGCGTSSSGACGSGSSSKEGAECVGVAGPANSGSNLQAADDNRDSFYTAFEVLSDGDE